MKNFFGNRKNIMSVSTVFVVLITMIAVTHYYLQYDRVGTAWALTLGYGFLFIQSVITLIYGSLNKKSNITLLGAEFVVLSLIMLVYCILNLVTVFSAVYFHRAGLMLPLVLIPAYADGVLSEKSLLKKWIYVIPAAVVAIAVTVFVCISQASIIATSNAAHKIYYVVGALFCIFGLVLSVLNLLKKKNEFFAWSLAAYSFLGLVMFILKVFEKISLAEKFLSLQNLGAAIMLISVLTAEQVKVKAAKKKHR